MIDDLRCPVCEATLVKGLRTWHRRCSSCRYEGSTLEPGVNQGALHAAIDEAARAEGLHELRVENFRELLGHMAAAGPSGGRLLEVGCAHGWFLELARESYDVVGIEPDEAVARETAARGLPVRNDFFPAALADGEVFDAIVFNDVFEHIPAAGEILDHCRTHLSPGAMLVLNLPSSRGIFYRLASLFCRMGSDGAFKRMWQYGLPSPHVHYFDPDNLARLLGKHGFEIASQGALATLRWKGLYSRIAYAGHANVIVRVMQFLCIAAMLPALAVLPRDIMFVIARKTQRQGSRKQQA